MAYRKSSKHCPCGRRIEIVHRCWFIEDKEHSESLDRNGKVRHLSPEEIKEYEKYLLDRKARTGR